MKNHPFIIPFVKKIYFFSVYLYKTCWIFIYIVYNRVQGSENMVLKKKIKGIKGLITGNPEEIAKYLASMADTISLEDADKYIKRIAKTRNTNTLDDFIGELYGYTRQYRVSVDPRYKMESEPYNLYLSSLIQHLKNDDEFKIDATLVNSLGFYFPEGVEALTSLSEAENLIIKTESVDSMIKFAQSFPNANKSKLIDTIIESGNARDLLKFMRNVPTTNISKAEDAIIKLGSAYDMLGFMQQVSGANKLRLLKEVIFTGNQEAIEYGLKLHICYEGTLNEYLLENKIVNSDDYVNFLDYTTNEDYENLLLSLNNVVGKKQTLEFGKKNNSLNNQVNRAILNRKIISSVSKENNIKNSLWLINLSLSRSNVSPSVVKDIKEVRENTALYLDLLNRCDPIKYHYYRDAFNNVITFEEADCNYKYYYNHGYNERIEKLKYDSPIVKTLKLK